jgi:hypothetical protein
MAFGIFQIIFIIYVYKQRDKGNKSAMKYTKGQLLVNYELRVNDKNRQMYVVGVGQGSIQQAYREISIGIITGLVFILFILINIIVFRIVHTNHLNAKLAELRTAGYPVTAEERNAYYPAVPDIENAAIVYQKAFKLFHEIDDKIFEKNVNGNKYPKFIQENMFGDEPNGKTLDDKDKKVVDAKPKPKSFKELVIFAVPILGERLSEESQTASRQFIAGNRDAIQVLKQASELSRCRFPVDFTTDESIEQPHRNKLRFSMRLFALMAILNAEDGNTKQTAANILTMLNICHVMDNEPEMYSYLLRISMLRITVGVIEKTLSLIEFDDVTLQQLGKELEANLDKDGKLMERVLAMEQALLVDSDGIVGLKILYQRMHSLGLDTLNKLNLLRLNKGLLMLDKGNFNTVNKYQIEFGKKVENIPRRSLGNFFIRLLSSPFFDLHQNFTVEAKIKAAIIAVAIERYQLKYHTLPNKLNQLVPEFIQNLPDDPFTGKPFRYVVGDIELQVYDDEKYPESYEHSKAFYHNGIPMTFIKRPGWMVYSFGKDQDDDNGIAITLQEGDIPFRCVRK